MLKSRFTSDNFGRPLSQNRLTSLGSLAKFIYQVAKNMPENTAPSDKVESIAQPTDNAISAPEITEARTETNSFVPPDSRTDTSAGVIPADFQIIDDSGAVLAGGPNDANIVPVGLSDKLGDEPEREGSITGSAPLDKLVRNVEAFGFAPGGDMLGAREGKEALEGLARLTFSNKGEEGLKQMTDFLNNRALDRFGDEAFNATDPKVDAKMQGDAVTMQVTNRTGNSMDVQFNFLAPNSNEIRSHRFKLDTTPGLAPRPVFDRTTPV